MKLSSLPLLATALIASAASAAALTWNRSSALDGSFSVETLCSEDEIDNYRQAPEDFSNGLRLPKQSRVICLQDGLLMTAGLFDVGEAPGSASAFDALLGEMSKDSAAKKPDVVTIGGRRAILNRETRDGLSAQTGVVEFNKGQVILLIVGYQPGNSAGPNEQAQVIDRFTQSLKVPGK